MLACPRVLRCKVDLLSPSLTSLPPPFLHVTIYIPHLFTLVILSHQSIRMEEMYRAAASFFDEAPWFLLSSHNIIEIRNMNTNEHRVIQICGYPHMEKRGEEGRREEKRREEKRRAEGEV